jgi:hypothetical protein
MTSCKACGAPLDGPMAFIARLMGVQPSKIAPGYCNKCEDMALAKKRVGSIKPVVKKAKKTAKRAKKKTTKRKSSKKR